jgi:hypothetical protein
MDPSDRRYGAVVEVAARFASAVIAPSRQFGPRFIANQDRAANAGAID